MRAPPAGWVLCVLALGAPRAQQASGPARGAPAVEPELAGATPAALAELAASAADTTPETPAPERPLSARYGAPLSLEEIERELQALAREHPGVVRRESLGTSRDGYAIPLLVLSRAETGPERDKPGLLLVGDRGSAPLDEAEAESALAFAWSVAAGDDAELVQLLERACVYVLPVLDPDARARREGVGLASLDADFPCGWQPPQAGPRASCVPLSRPEALAVTRFLAEHANLALVLGRLPVPAREPLFASELVPASDLGPIPPEDGAAYAELLAGLDPGAAGWGFPTVPAGTLFDYAYFAQGIFAAGWPPAPSLQGEPDARAFEARVGERVRVLALLARALPRLELSLAEPLPSSSGVWCLDVRVANDARLPTESALSAAGRADRGIVLAVRGARVMASALREAQPGPFRLPTQVSAAAGLVRLGRLAPHGERWVRLLLEAAPGAEITVEARGAWAASTAQSVRLP